MLEYHKQQLLASYKYFLTFIIWIIFSSIIGVIVGIVGTLFHYGVERATDFRMEHPGILWLLPFAGLFIVFLYHFDGMDKNQGTNCVLVGVRNNEKVTLKLAPLIFISTILTHLFGGSSGREGAALQLGGSISSKIGRIMKLDDKDERVLTMCGMSAAFSALFGTPITSVLFSMEVITVGVMHYSAIVPCVIAALIGTNIASYFGINPTIFPLTSIPSKLTLELAINIIILGISCAILSIFFCSVIEKVSHLYKKYLHNAYIRIFVGGCLVIAFTYLVGSRDYNGVGMDIIQKALQGEAKPEAFLLKILFTALTLGCGYKGGEIVPAFFVGATFGNIVGGFLGLSPSFGAALGLAGIFCGVTNCPLTSIILSIELFGGKGIIYYTLVCAISYMLSGYYGLYSEQKIMYSKLKPVFINKNVS